VAGVPWTVLQDYLWGREAVYAAWRSKSAAGSRGLATKETATTKTMRPLSLMVAPCLIATMSVALRRRLLQLSLRYPLSPGGVYPFLLRILPRVSRIMRNARRLQC
jgi:hypothetical protein